MATKELSQDNFVDTVTSEGIHLVDFWADWCGPCKQFAPVYEEASEQHSDVTFTKVDTEANQQLSASMGIQSIPTLMAFRDGVLLFQQAGALPARALEDVIKAVKEVDMDEVRQKIAEQEAQQGEQPNAEGAQV
ncbi:MAG: thioredoxin [Leucobacter sp.]